MLRLSSIAVAAALLVAATQVHAQTPYPQTYQGSYPTAQTVPPAQIYGNVPPAQPQVGGNVNWQNYLSTHVANNTPTVAPVIQYESVPQPQPQPQMQMQQQMQNQALPSYDSVAPAYGNACCETYPACDVPCQVTCTPPITARWIASVGAMFVTREPQDSYTFSYDSANEANQYVDAADADMEFSSGVEASIGRFDACSNYGWQVTYWQLFPGDESTQQLGADLSPGFLDGIRNYDQLDYSGGGVGDGATAADNVNNAQIHRLTRSWDLYNLEASGVFLMPQPQCGSLWHFRTLTGFRYLKFSESLLFESDPSETMIDGDADEYRIAISTDNQLCGFQLGGITERYVGSRWCVQMIAKAGLYNNHAQLNYFEGGSAGAATINNGPNAGQSMRVNTSTNDLAFLGEFGVGVTRRIGSAWRLGADYRMIGATGIALPTDQIYFDTRGINDVRVIDNDGSLLLHGATVRLERCF
ncbi:BBP7 family outer membrane beta-barrel protein [Aeoliella mucimassa]|uniref:Uncharacterized protein n=1 Tax=Aeoliella mucimassa TaxID=2527972 RepID=A0A518AWG4_9BACT|nr:BBP7 family outer membrane beta-barrel protein [Aeoliella mucimassa]QDU59056.1 hypothetical protein Pan181_52970 [Aeoliella mucimassa]